MVSSTASSLIVLFIIFTSFKFASLTRYAPSVRDIFAPQMRYCIAVRNSDMFAYGERGGKYALYKSSRRAVRGISLAVRQISQAVLISQIREDLYRFSLSASSDKLNFPRGWRGQNECHLSTSVLGNISTSLLALSVYGNISNLSQECIPYF